MKKVITVTVSLSLLLGMLICVTGCGKQVNKQAGLEMAGEHGKEAKPDIATKPIPDDAVKSSYTNIFDAASKGTVQDIRYFIEKGERVNMVDKDNWTPLHYAIRDNKNVDVIEFLVGWGASVTAKNDYGWTAIDMARKYRSKAEAASLSFMQRVEREREEMARLNSQRNDPYAQISKAYAERNANETPEKKQERLLKADLFDLEERARLLREPHTIMRTNPYR